MTHPTRHRSPFTIFALATLVIVGGTMVLTIEESFSPLVGALVGINLAAIALYGYDKGAAVKNWLRVPENVLHVVAILGGSPGALLGQRLFRHKTAKTSFRIWFWLIVAGQLIMIAAALWWHRHPPSWLPAAFR